MRSASVFPQYSFFDTSDSRERVKLENLLRIFYLANFKKLVLTECKSFYLLTSFQKLLDSCLLTDDEMAMGPEKWEEELVEVDKINLTLGDDDDEDEEGEEEEEEGDEVPRKFHCFTVTLIQEF